MINVYLNLKLKNIFSNPIDNKQISIRSDYVVDKIDNN